MNNALLGRSLHNSHWYKFAAAAASVLISATTASIKIDSLQVSGSSSSIDRKPSVGDTNVPTRSASFQILYEGEFKIFRTDAVKIINLITNRVWKLPTSTQLLETWSTDSLGMVVPPFTGTSRYHNCCINGGTSLECFGFTLVYLWGI
jgi:hypothetical protein